MVVSCNVRNFTMVWMRRFVYSFIGVTGATGALVMLMGVILVASGVLEW